MKKIVESPKLIRLNEKSMSYFKKDRKDLIFIRLQIDREKKRRQFMSF